MKKRFGQWAFILAGIAIAVWAVVSIVWPSTNCRGEEMGPGDVCTYSSRTEVDTEQTQTYEERIAAARQQAPVGLVSGLAMAGFGLYLVRRDARAAEPADAR